MAEIFKSEKTTGMVLEFLDFSDSLRVSQLNRFFQKETLGNVIFYPQMLKAIKTKGKFWKMINQKNLENKMNALEDRYLQETKLDLFLRRFMMYDYNPHNVGKEVTEDSSEHDDQGSDQTAKRYCH